VRLSTFRYFGAQAWSNVRRHLSPTAAMVILISLFTLGAFLGVIRNTESIGADLVSGFQVVAYLRADASPVDPDGAVRRIEGIPGVVGCDVRTKQMELERLVHQFPAYEEVIASLQENPLADAVVVDIDNPERAAEIASSIARIDSVDEVVYGTLAAERLASFARGLRTLSLAGTVFMVVVISLVVGSVVGLTIEYRAAEIEVASLVGATKWFIMWPFILEGAILALMLWAAGASAVVALYLPVVRFFQRMMPFASFADSWRDVYAVCLQLLVISFVSFEIATFVALRRLITGVQKG
jgi:cell division transport system permease protein